MGFVALYFGISGLNTYALHGAEPEALKFTVNLACVTR